MVSKIEKTDVHEAFKKIGQKIAERRKSLRKKFPGVSKKLNINVEYLKYIEEGKVDKIPDHIPAKGFVKTYAKLLNVDIEDELNTVEQSLESVQRKKKSDLSIKQNPKVNFVYFILIFIFLLTLSYLVNVNDSTNVDNNFFFGTNNKKDLMMNKNIIS
mgnify:FL=1